MKKDLIALRDAVKAKKEFEWEFAAKVIGIRPDNRHVHFMKAKNGSVDAALVFLAAVLPGWDWEISSSNAAAVFKGPLLTGPTGRAFVRRSESTFG